MWTDRPGRSSAGSRRSGRFVAPITKTLLAAPADDIPSSSASSWLTILSITPPESPWFPRFGATESSSSKKMTHGLASRARWNTRRTFASDSPMYMLSSSGPLTEKKFREQDVATALARSVLPVPGGPYKRIPVERECEQPYIVNMKSTYLIVALSRQRIVQGGQEAIGWYRGCLPSHWPDRQHRPMLHSE